MRTLTDTEIESVSGGTGLSTLIQTAQATGNYSYLIALINWVQAIMQNGIATSLNAVGGTGITVNPVSVPSQPTAPIATP
jgi:hypothetical protein